LLYADGFITRVPGVCIRFALLLADLEYRRFCIAGFILNYFGNFEVKY